jgi:hypothetical protein
MTDDPEGAVGWSALRFKREPKRRFHLMRLSCAVAESSVSHFIAAIMSL